MTTLRFLFTRRRLAAALALGAAVAVPSQPLPNPYRLVDGWAKLPPGRTMGAVGDLTISPDGKHLWASPARGGSRNT